MFNATFNNITVTLIVHTCIVASILMMEENRVPEKNTDLPQLTDKQYHIIKVVSSTTRHERNCKVYILQIKQNTITQGVY